MIMGVFLNIYYSVPNGLVFEKMHLPDGLRIVDGIVDTLLY